MKSYSTRSLAMTLNLNEREHLLQFILLNIILYEKFNLRLPTENLIPYVKVARLSAYAYYVTSIRQPNCTGLIRVITLCLPNGRIIRIDANDENFAIIRVAHLGLFGIILSIELECTEIKKLQCIMESSIDGLSPSNHDDDDKHIFGIDFISSSKLNSFKIFRDRIVNYFVNELNAKLHWDNYAHQNINDKKIYGEEFKIFKGPLENWYRKYNLYFEKNMLMNNFFAGIPQYKWLHADGNDEHANNLKKNLQTFTLKPLNDTPMLFKPRHVTGPKIKQKISRKSNKMKHKICAVQ